MNITAIIQARMGSCRLPCKMMLDLHGAPMIDWVVERTAKSKLLNHIVVAIPDTPLNDILRAHLCEKGIQVFLGPEEDVLKRFHAAASKYQATHVVRICADNPLVWGPEIDRLIEEYLALPPSVTNYAYNHIPTNNLYPDGVGAEMVSYETLSLLEHEARIPPHREHCFSYIWDNPRQFNIHTFDPADLRLHAPNVKLDIDTPEDYRKIYMLPLHKGMPPELAVSLYRSLTSHK